MDGSGRVLRVFEVRVKEGCVDTLLSNFATTSVDVVRDKPGNDGYFFGRCVQGGENTVMFVSVWRDLNAVKARFGDDWEVSYMPDGYEELIDDCFVRHFELEAGSSLKGL
ncbi:MAG: antibiotic biosynthesis monooxygenase [Minwuia sp.]|uniref:antibiotic biosynthesis monooxygenase n=1 Tax=Minwuia sp. TaxID=2493630 RepID=UPI003A8BD8CB